MTENSEAACKQMTRTENSTKRPLKILTAVQVHKIDDILAEIGPFGEVRLIKSKGKVRFITTVETEDAIESRDVDTDQTEND